MRETTEKKDANPRLELRLLDQAGDDLPRVEVAGQDLWQASIGRSLLIELCYPPGKELEGAPEDGDPDGEAGEEPAGKVFQIELSQVDPETEREVLFRSRLVGNRVGELRPTCIWPQLGFDDLADGTAQDCDQLLEQWADRQIEVRVVGGDQTLVETLIVAPEFLRPVIFNAGFDGGLCNAMEAGAAGAVVSARGIGKSDYRSGVDLEIEGEPPLAGGFRAVRLWLVAHRPEWRVGDEFVPIKLGSRRAAVCDYTVVDGKINAGQLAADFELAPGSYDIVCEVDPAGEPVDGEQRLTSLHSVTRAVPALTVWERPPSAVNMRYRELSSGGGEVDGDVQIVQIPHLRIPGPPYFEPSQTFDERSHLYAALNLVRPLGDAVTSEPQQAEFYVIGHEGPDQLGGELKNAEKMESGSLIMKLQAQSMACPVFLLWPGLMRNGDGGHDPFAYDVVARVTPAAARPAEGDRDPAPDKHPGGGQVAPEEEPLPSFDSSCCVISGGIAPGVRVVTDPGTYQKFYHIGRYRYSERLPVRSSLASLDPQLSDGDRKNYIHTTGIVCFPSRGRDRNDPIDLTRREAFREFFGRTLPVALVVIAHGSASSTHDTEHDHLGFEYLAEHLAGQGIITTSVFVGTLPHSGISADERVEIISRHILTIEKQFRHIRIDRIGLVGHSAAGDAIAQFLKRNTRGEFRDFEGEVRYHKVYSILAIAPVDSGQDFKEVAELARPDADQKLPVPVVSMIYGSLDSDIAGTGGPHEEGGEGAAKSKKQSSPFRIFDRAKGITKSFAFVVGANHSRFNSEWDNEKGAMLLDAEDRLNIVSRHTHEAVVRGFAAALFLPTLRQEWHHWRGVLTGEWLPPSLVIADEGQADVRMLYRERASRIKCTIDFEETPQANGGSSKTPGHPKRQLDHKLGDGIFTISGAMSIPKVDAFVRADPFSPHISRGLLVRWHHNPEERDHVPRLTFDLGRYRSRLGSAAQLAEAVISFKVGQRFASELNPAGKPQDFMVELSDGRVGRSVRVSCFGTIPPPATRSRKTANKSAMNTIRIPIAAFLGIGLEEGWPSPDLQRLDSLSFEFGVTPRGEIWFDEIEIVDRLRLASGGQASEWESDSSSELDWIGAAAGDAT